MGKKITLIGAGIVGIATACYLRRDGHDVTVVTMHAPGEYCSFGNAGMLNPSSCVPQAMPGVLAKVPGYLSDPLGPLTIRPSYLMRALPWLVRFSFPEFGTTELILTGIIVAVGGQLGDLTISVMKRDIGIKDMGAMVHCGNNGSCSARWGLYVDGLVVPASGQILTAASGSSLASRLSVQGFLDYFVGVMHDMIPQR